MARPRARCVRAAHRSSASDRASIGLIATGVNRSLDEWTESFLRRNAYVFGGDLRHRWGASRYEVNARLTGSVVRGSAEAIASTQASSVHYSQRPDDGLTVDPTRTSLGGDAQELSISKMGGNMVRWLTSYERQSPGYEPNDLGYLRRANRQTWKTWTGLNFQRPTRVYRQMSFNFNYQGYWTAEGLPTDHWINSNGGVSLANNNWLNYSIGMGGLGDSFCDECARGGPAVRSSRNVSMNGGWNGDSRKSVIPYAPYTAPANYTRDFNVKDLRSNSVVRWEFRPGSTLFAVRTHGRSGFESTFDDRPWRDEYKDVFALRPDNTFLVKLAYWMNP